MRLYRKESTMRFVFAVCGLAVGLCVWAMPARAVIQVKKPISEIYSTGASQVIVGRIARVNLENRVIEVEVTETIKGEAAGERVLVQVRSPEALIKEVAAGQPIALLVSKARGRSFAAVAMADTWVTAEFVGEGKAARWLTSQENQDMIQSFPGRTVALVRLLQELKGGKSTMLNAVDDAAAFGLVGSIGKLAIGRPTFLVGADVNSDKHADLLVGTGEGVRLLLNANGAFADATEAWGLKGVAGSQAAFGDVNGDGRVDLLLGAALFINEGQSFKSAGKQAGLPADGQVLAMGFLAPKTLAVLKKDGQLQTFALSNGAWTAGAARAIWRDEPAATSAALGDFGDDGQMHAMVVGEAGVSRYALDEGGARPADFLRLTGSRLGLFDKEGQLLKGAVAGAFDLNGDGRSDVLVLGEQGTLLLFNRGFGAFFASVHQ